MVLLDDFHMALLRYLIEFLLKSMKIPLEFAILSLESTFLSLDFIMGSLFLEIFLINSLFVPLKILLVICNQLQTFFKINPAIFKLFF